MRIDSLYLKDVGPFDEVTIDFPKGTNPALADVYLLTGENGCGKSTVLYAIASLVGKAQLGRDLVARRFRSEGSLVATRLDSGAVHGRGPGHRDAKFIPAVPNPYDHGSELSYAGRIDGNYYSFKDTDDLCDFVRATEYLQHTRTTRFSWGAFAYSGTRHTTEVTVAELREPAGTAFTNALDFVNSQDWDRFMYWIAGQFFRLLKAQANDESARAAELRAGITAIENVVSKIVDADFRFKMPVEDNNVRAVVDGRELAMDLLPTGLQSIVSWVADLLVRLERTPWVNDTPILKRPFLLLLDEIDIHLHPAWQRRILPMVAELFPNAQIIASTHSPFVVASAGEDARIIRFEVKDGRSTLDPTKRGAQAGTSVSAVLADVFGIKTEFDIDTEEKLEKFSQAKRAILEGTSSDREGLRALGREIAARGEELSSIIGFELRQLDRLLATPAHVAR